jgi:hypothetical protein
MSTVVHNIKSYRRNYSSEQHAFKNGYCCMWRKKNQVGIQTYQANSQNSRFEIERKISGRRLSQLIKIGIDPFFKICMEII